MTTELRSFDWAPETEFFITVISEESQYWELTLDFLKEQPESWEPWWTFEELQKLLRRGVFRALIVVANKEAQGIIVYSAQEYGKGIISAKIEFLSCKRFFSMARYLDAFENLMFARGATMIEAIAHPTIASYAVTKAGYTCNNVHIVKTLCDPERSMH